MLIDPVFNDERNNIPFVEGTNKIYSQYGIGILAIFIPIVLFAKLFCFFTDINEIILTHFLLSFYNIPFAILALWNFKQILKNLGQNNNTANFLMICFCVGTIFWKYVVTDFSEVTQVSFLLGAIYWYTNKNDKRKWFFISLYLSLLVLLKLLYVIIIPIFVLLSIYESKKDNNYVKRFYQGASFLVPTGIFLMFMNWYRFGSIMESGYGNSQTAFSFTYFKRDYLDYLISFERGIIPYSPVILASILSLNKLFFKHKSFLFVVCSTSLLLFCLYASWVGWKGGYCWGNRNLVPIIPILCLSWAFIDFTKRKQLSFFYFLLAISIPLQIVSVSIKTHEWSVLSREFKDHDDPYYVPNSIKGSSLLFKEKMSNTTGIYQSESFVPEHFTSIDLRGYNSFTGYNFWTVHFLKFLNLNNYLNITGNFILVLIVTILAYLLQKFRLKS